VRLFNPRQSRPKPHRSGGKADFTLLMRYEAGVAVVFITNSHVL
jgi:hypothetical protein